ncbi:MAG: hypothetical protein JW839_22170 [Candidatus Lokiarchaeota archaeon]|nr:hypothetical protein [Candidatus Lokiarchaeota archaeon]
MLAQIAGMWIVGIFAPVIYLVLAIVANVPISRKRKQGIQSLNLSFTVWLTFTVTMTMLRFVEYIQVINNGVLPGSYYIGEALSTWYIVPMLSVMAQLQFVLYIMRKYKFYSVPAILTFFLSLGLFQYDSTIAYNVVMIPLCYTASFLFLWKGVKNRDGLTFSLGMFSLFDYGIPYFIYSPVKYMGNMGGAMVYAPFLICALISVAFLNLGTWGWLDKHVFYDKERERRIKNAWVSRLIEIEKKKPEARKAAGRCIVVECPICHRQARKQFPQEVVLERARNEKGIVKMLLNQEKEVCEHQFVAYVDRSFSIRGYEPIDMMV